MSPHVAPIQLGDDNLFQQESLMSLPTDIMRSDVKNKGNLVKTLTHACDQRNHATCIARRLGRSLTRAHPLDRRRCRFSLNHIGKHNPSAVGFDHLTPAHVV